MPDVLLSTRLSPSPTPPLTRPPLVPQAAQLSTLHRERKQSLETICELRARIFTSQQAQLSLQRRVIELEKQLPDAAQAVSTPQTGSIAGTALRSGEVLAEAAHLPKEGSTSPASATSDELATITSNAGSHCAPGSFAALQRRISPQPMTAEPALAAPESATTMAPLFQAATAPTAAPAASLYSYGTAASVSVPIAHRPGVGPPVPVSAMGAAAPPNLLDLLCSAAHVTGDAAPAGPASTLPVGYAYAYAGPGQKRPFPPHAFDGPSPPPSLRGHVLPHAGGMGAAGSLARIRQQALATRGAATQGVRLPC